MVAGVSSRPPRGTGRGAGRAGRRGTVPGPEHAQHLARLAPAQPDVDEQPDDRAHHLVAEGVGPDLEPEHARRRARPTRPPAPGARAWARAGRDRGQLGRRQNDEKSCSPINGSHAEPQQAARRAAGRRARSVAARNGSGTSRVQHRVAVAAPDGREAGVEVRLGPPRPSARRWRARPGRSGCAGAAREVEAVGGHVEADHLTPGVHAGVGAAGTRSARPAARSTVSRWRRKVPPTVATSAFSAKPWKPDPVVGDEQPHSLHRGALRLEQRHPGKAPFPRGSG